MTIAISDGAASLIADLIHDHMGMLYTPDRYSMMIDKLQPVAREKGCRSFLDLYYSLKAQGHNSPEWKQVMDALSIQETYFWREVDQVRVLVDILVPDWFKKNITPLRIWSAACATGEEPYSIAMALNEAGWFTRAPIQIHASDASVSALQKAQRGIYRERAFRNLPAHLRDKYFSKVEQGWRLDPLLASHVRFHQANLVDADEIAPLASVPIIFCRNVFIYFSPEAIRRTVQNFARFMPSGGCLCVGACESLLKLTTDFELREIADVFVYVRNDKAPASSSRGLALTRS